MGSATTSAEAELLQSRIAAGLRHAGFELGDRVGLALDSGPRQLAIIGAALRIGVVPVVTSPSLTPRERTIIDDDSRPRCWLDQAVVDAWLEIPGGVELAPMPRGRPLLYTSGTTGRPKGVWSGLLDDRDATALWHDDIAQWSITAADTYLACSPFYHSASIRLGLATWLSGGAVAALPRFDAEHLGDAITSSGATFTFCSPAHLQRLHDAGTLSHLQRLRLVLHAGAPCPAPLKRAAIAAVGTDRLWEFYGSTEGQFTVCSSPEWLEHPGTVGRARAGRTIRVDDDGLIWCRPPAWARWTYWGDEQRSAEAWDTGWFTVGDLGSIDADGYLYLTARRSDLIITGGVNVYPAEVEQVLREAPGVLDVAVYPRADERWGQMVCAAVVIDEPDQLAELRVLAERDLAPHKRPKRLDIVTEIPRVGLGKVARHQLADQIDRLTLDTDWTSR